MRIDDDDERTIRWNFRWTRRVQTSSSSNLPLLLIGAFLSVVVVDQTTQKIREEEKKRTQQTLAITSTYGSIARRAFAWASSSSSCRRSKICLLLFDLKVFDLFFCGSALFNKRREELFVFFFFVFFFRWKIRSLIFCLFAFERSFLRHFVKSHLFCVSFVSLLDCILDYTRDAQKQWVWRDGIIRSIKSRSKRYRRYHDE